MIAHAQGDMLFVGNLQPHGDVDAVGRILHRIVEQVGDGGAQLFGIARHHWRREPLPAACSIAQRLGLQMMAGARHFHALAHQCWQIAAAISRRPVLCPASPAFSTCSTVPMQAVGVVEHEPVELAALRLVHLAALQRLQVEADGSDRRLQFVGDGVDEAVVLLVAADFAHQKNRVENDARR